MAGRDKIAAQLARAVEQRAELELLVAQHARIGRAPGLVFRGEMGDDLLLKGLRLVNQIIRNAQPVADGARVGHGLRAAAFVLGARYAILRPELEGDAHHVVALLQQQRRRRRRIHPPAHADDDPRFFGFRHNSTIFPASD